MNAVVQSFGFGEQLVRVIDRENAPWFVARDVCAALEIENPTRALAGLEDDEKGLHSVNTLGGIQEMLIISESGMYATVFKSRKGAAKLFRKWVTQEVLPSLRRNGHYAMPAPANDDDDGEIYLGSMEEIERSRAIMLEVRTAIRLYGEAGGRQIWETAGKPIPPGLLTIAAAQTTAHPLVAAWFGERAERVSSARERAAALHEDFAAFCVARGVSPLSMKALAGELDRLGLESRKSNGMWRLGLRLRTV